ncbi:FAD/NAD(P)-binding oxidoreductase [Dactylosporangium sp. NPDC050588]|uniref:FAD/NAD(P)-binding oxidoreductase n=1 Tax=Dactylosporangium sp. NPDC050588 TaxID=3157211 RepID=UPI003405FFCB
MDGAEYIVSAGDLLFLPPGRLSVDVGDHEVLARFDGGRVLVGVTSTPFKCPPAPSETALMLHDLLSARGIRDRSRVDLVMPLGAPIPPSPAASAALLTAFAERGIGWHPNRLVRGLDPRRKVALLADGGELPFDLFLGVPVHRAPQVVLDSGMCVDGWIPVDSLTLRTRYEGVYAVGDVTSVGTPKAGVFAEGQAAVVAEQIIAAHRGDGASATYDGTGICFVEFGEERIGRVQVTFRRGERPFGTFDDASDVYRADKTEFGSSRVRRWFGRAWS